MRDRWVYLFEIALALMFLWLGLFGGSFLFVTGTRTAAITLGIIGILFYFFNTLGYVMRNPLHPIALIGSLAGAVGVILLIIQIFGWRFWIIGNPVVALLYIAAVMCLKGTLGFLMPLRPNE